MKKKEINKPSKLLASVILRDEIGELSEAARRAVSAGEELKKVMGSGTLEDVKAAAADLQTAQKCICDLADKLERADEKGRIALTEKKQLSEVFKVKFPDDKDFILRWAYNWLASATPALQWALREAIQDVFDT